MPTYEYRCKECGDEIEVVQSFTDDALTTCEKCGGPLRKVFGSIGVTFKGSGFYRTDSRSGSGSKPAEKADKSEKKSGDSTSASSGGESSTKTESTTASSSSSTKSEAKTA